MRPTRVTRIGVFVVMLATSSPALAGTDAWTVSSIGDGGVRALAVGPSSGVVYAGTMGSTIGGLYASNDAGATWHVAFRPGLSGALGGEGFSALAIDPSNEQVVYAGSRTRIYRSDDGAQHFAPLSLNATAWDTILVDPASPATVYAGLNCAGTARSPDRGATWVVPSTNALVEGLAFDPAVPGRLWEAVGGCPGPAPLTGILHSENGGATWTPVTSPGNNVLDLGATGGVAPALLATDALTGVWRSSDLGQTWTKTLNQFLVGKLLVDPVVTSTVYAGGDGGVWRSLDGGATWTLLKDVTAATWPSSVNALAIDPRNHNTLYAGGVTLDDLTGNVFSITFSGRPRALQAPTITGVPRVGRSLTCRPGRWSGHADRFDFTWTRDGKRTGVDEPGYEVGRVDATHRLTCSVTATGWDGPGTATVRSKRIQEIWAPRAKFVVPCTHSARRCAIVYRGTAMFGAGVTDPRPSSGIASVELAVTRTSARGCAAFVSGRWVTTPCRAAPRWRTVSRRPSLTVTLRNLSAGQYTARVRATDRDGNVQKTPDVLRFRVGP